MTTRPKIELRNIQVHVGLSEETPAYTAKLFVDGKHFADVSNDGHGGCDYVYPPKGKESGFQDRLQALEQTVKDVYPKHEFNGMTFDESLEVICHGLVWEHVDKRNLKSRLSRTVMTFEDGKIMIYKGKKSDALMNVIAEKKPSAIILNRLAFDEAYELTRQVA